MKIGVIHLSDIHLKETQSENHILKRVDKIYEAVRNCLTESDEVIILVTGDVAFSGKAKEYDFAYNFFSDLISKIETYLKHKIFILFIPGNHDCDFSGDQTIRNMIIDQVKSTWYKNINDQVIEVCNSVQNNFESFKAKFQPKGFDQLLNHPLLNVYDFQKGEKNIIFNCFNTSWISKLREEEGQMAFPTEYFSDEAIFHKSNLTINLIHHPINWQNNTHHREFRKLLEDSGDLILSGHEHETNQREVSELGGETTVYLESAALQTDIATQSSFNLYKFDLDLESYTYFQFSLENGTYLIKKTLENRKYDHRYNLSKKEFSYENKFLHYLNSTDAQYTHPQTDNLVLSDIYIDLKLREVSLDEKESLTLPKYISAKNLGYKPQEKIKWCINGSESSGKTALLKVLTMRLYNQDFIPVFLRGENLSDISIEKLKKYIKACFIDQYSKKCHNKFDRIDKNKLILVIDNFQNCNIRGKFRIQMLQSLQSITDHQIYAANTMLVFEPIRDDKKNIALNYFETFTSYHIAEMGANLRYELIERWNKVGRDFSTDEEKNGVYQLNDTYNSQIKATLGLNYIPNHPFYILTLLTSLSSGKSSADYSLSGYYYESLINNSLDNSVTDKDSLQFYNQFLSELFYFLFENKMKNIAISSFQTFFKDFCDKYEISEDLEKVIRALLNAKIIRINNEFVTFSYRYVYYYFVAKYFATNISDPKYKDQISKMCKRLYREEFSNVIIFLTHLSKDPFIINEIYSNAQELFSETPITKLEEDILSINKLVDDIPELVLNGSPIEENRALKYLSEAEAEELENEFETNRANLDYDVNEDIAALDFLNQMIRAIKTYELLGQITKKYWGSIKGNEKYNYAKETFDLALRTLNTYFQHILDDSQSIIAALKYIAKKKHIEDISTMKDIANSYVFKLCCMVSQGSIQRVSNSIGHRKLRETFENIVSNEPNNSYRILDVAIKLDHSSFPHEEIEGLINDKEFNKNFLPKYLLQNLVFNYLTLYSTDIKEKQQIYDRLQIKIKDQRRADLSSQVKK